MLRICLIDSEKKMPKGERERKEKTEKAFATIVMRDINVEIE